MSPLFTRRAAGLAVPLITLALLGLMAFPFETAAQEPTAPDRAALRKAIEARYEAVPLSRGIGLRPRDRTARIRMIEIADGTIAIDGVPVTARELNERVGDEIGRLIGQLSYLDTGQQHAVFGLTEEEPAPPPVEAPRETPQVERQMEPVPELPADRPAVTRRRVGQRVRVFGSVTVPRDESVSGQVVAVMGSVRVDGHVAEQVVAVMGSVDLGPEAVVGGDVVAVGGRVHQAQGAQVRGDVTEIDLGSAGIPADFRGAPWWIAPGVFHPFTGVARLTGTIFRLVVLGLLASIVVLVIRQPVEHVGQRVAAEPVKMAAIGLLAQLLFFPMLFLTTIILLISIVGIPVAIVLIPAALVALLFVMLGGFTAAAYVVGGWFAGRARWNVDQPYLRVWLGVLIVLTPLLIARLFGMVGGPFQLAALMVAAAALLIEYFVWTTGFGAALAATFQNWRTRRAVPASVPTPAMPDTGPRMRDPG